MNVLIVDDDAGKVKRVVECLRAGGVELSSINECRSAYAARELMSKSSYDLLVLDVVLPERMDSEPKADVGVKLLAEIRGRSKYCVPDHIVGLTAYADVHANAEAEFLGLGWLLLRYDPSREDWARALRNMAQQIIWARESVRSAKGVYSSDLAVVCALEDPELESVLSLPWNWDKWRENGDATVYYRGSIGGGERVVFAAASARMGLPSAAVLAMKMICAFQPRYIVDVGIAASFVGRANFGDVLAADLSWDYGSGKYARVEGAGAFLQGPNQYQLNADLRGRIGELAREDSLLQEVYKRWRGDRPETQLRIVVGPMASGAAVVADEARAKEISLQHGKLLGIDMEAYAVFDAAAESPMPRPAAFSLKGVTDFADSKKDDRFRQYAAYTSAECLRLLAERYLG